MREWNKEDIRGLRDRLKLSQRAFSELIGVTENYIYLLEKGVRVPSKTLRLFLDCIERETKGKRKGKGG